MSALSYLRPRFSIRVLLALVTLLTLFVAFIDYHWSWIRQRHAALDGVHVRQDGDPPQTPAPAPGMLFLFGEAGYADLSVSRAAWSNASKRDRLRSIFPETRFYLLYSDSEMLRDPFEE